ncbi:unnamed protein product [Brassica oleracea var. botrytis]|uniref:Uncharacterized protein n=1 Tax=Brassica cretica TaxID=69181 RepID=A0A8S9S4E1_BRACR|nr:hypothetical protein F2Q69_00029256 [Brassica cretica]
MNEDDGDDDRDGGDDGDRDYDGVDDGVDDKDFEDNDGYVNHISLKLISFVNFKLGEKKIHCCKLEET